jgi:hypothetical protein
MVHLRIVDRKTDGSGMRRDGKPLRLTRYLGMPSKVILPFGDAAAARQWLNLARESRGPLLQ